MLTFMYGVFWFSFGFVRGLSNLGKDDGTSGFFRRGEGVFVFLRKVFWRGRKEGWMVSSVLRGRGGAGARHRSQADVWVCLLALAHASTPTRSLTEATVDATQSLTLSAALFFFFLCGSRWKEDSDDEILQVRSKFSRDFFFLPRQAAWQATKGRNRV
jgi:hypothetical protein